MSNKTQTRKQPAKKRTASRASPEVKPTKILKDSALPHFAEDRWWVRVYVHRMELRAKTEIAQPHTARRSSSALPRWAISLVVALVVGYVLPAEMKATIRGEAVAMLLRNAVSTK